MSASPPAKVATTPRGTTKLAEEGTKLSPSSRRESSRRSMQHDFSATTELGHAQVYSTPVGSRPNVSPPRLGSNCQLVLSSVLFKKLSKSKSLRTSDVSKLLKSRLKA